MKTLNISCVDNLVFECQTFLEELQHSDLGEKVRLAVHFSDPSGTQNKVQLYQEAAYVFVQPEGQNPLMYGNWEEALYAVKRKMVESVNTRDKSIIMRYNNL